MRPTVFFATPYAGQMVTADYAVSLAAASAHLAANGIKTLHTVHGGYDVASQRDTLADVFLNQTKATHIQFVDADIGFPAALTAELLKVNKPIIGALYPFRGIDGDLLERFIKSGRAAEDALRLAHKFAFDCDDFQPSGGVGEVRAVGGGYLLIAREVFERMVASGVEEYRLHRSPRPIRRFFPWGQKDGERVPEDWSFCYRWRELGGQVFGYALADMTHVAPFRHVANMHRFMEAVKTG